MQSLQMSYFPNYFSIEDILATNEKVPCKFESTVPKLGSLDSSADSEDLKEGTKLELPYWLVPILVSKKIVSATLPKYYKANYRQILKADPSVVDLHKWGPYFYEFGSYVTALDPQETMDTRSCLVQTLQHRLRTIMDTSQNASHQDTIQLISHLDQLERELFRVGNLSLNSFNEWLRRESNKLTIATLVENHRKRKHAEVESTAD